MHFHQVLIRHVLSAAEQYAEKKRLAMEKAERIKAERRAKEEAARRAGGGGGGGGGGFGGFGGGGPPQRPAWNDDFGGASSVSPDMGPRNAYGTPSHEQVLMA